MLGKVNQENVQLLNEVDRIAFVNSVRFLPFDAFTSAAFLFPDKVITKSNRRNVIMELQGLYARGQMVIDHLSEDYNVNIIEEISEEEFKQIMLWTAHYESKSRDN